MSKPEEWFGRLVGSKPAAGINSTTPVCTEVICVYASSEPRILTRLLADVASARDDGARAARAKAFERLTRRSMIHELGCRGQYDIIKGGQQRPDELTHFQLYCFLDTMRRMSARHCLATARLATIAFTSSTIRENKRVEQSSSRRRAHFSWKTVQTHLPTSHSRPLCAVQPSKLEAELSHLPSLTSLASSQPSLRVETSTCACKLSMRCNVALCVHSCGREEAAKDGSEGEREDGRWRRTGEVAAVSTSRCVDLQVSLLLLLVGIDWLTDPHSCPLIWCMTRRRTASSSSPADSRH